MGLYLIYLSYKNGLAGLNKKFYDRRSFAPLLYVAATTPPDYTADPLQTGGQLIFSPESRETCY